MVYVHLLLWATRVYTFFIIYYEKKVFKHWWSTIPTLSTNRKAISNQKLLKTKKTTTCGVGSFGPVLIRAQTCGGVKLVDLDLNYPPSLWLDIQQQYSNKHSVHQLKHTHYHTNEWPHNQWMFVVHTLLGKNVEFVDERPPICDRWRHCMVEIFLLRLDWILRINLYRLVKVN